MEISHVIRGDEWLPSAPRHFLLYQAFGWEPPLIAHVSRILGPDKSKLSKRHGAHSVLEYRDQGYLPDAVVNFLALLGCRWTITPRSEPRDLIRHFDLDRVCQPAVFNADKLLWFNGMYILKCRRRSSRRRYVRALRTGWELGSTTTACSGSSRLCGANTSARGDRRYCGLLLLGRPAGVRGGALLGKKFAGEPSKAAAALEAVTQQRTAFQSGLTRPWRLAAPLAETLGMKAAICSGNSRGGNRQHGDAAALRDHGDPGQ